MPTTHALLIAGGKYLDNRIPELQAPHNDLRLMLSLLLYRYRVPAKNILVVGAKPGSLGAGLSYQSELATRASILSGLKVLEGRVGKDDTMIGYYSGHGARLANVALTRSSDPVEWNALVPADYDPLTFKNLVLEYELWEATARLKTRQRTWVLDCCFSGGFGSRAGVPSVDNWEARYVSKALGQEFKPTRQAAPFPARPQLPPDPSPTILPPFALLAACQEHQRAEEVRFLPAKGRTPCAVSEFTWALYHTLWHAPTPLTLAEAGSRVAERLHKRGLDQSPLVVAGKFPQASRVCLAPLTTKTPLPFPVDPKANRLLVGRLAGLAPGQRFREQNVQVTQVDWFDARLEGRLSPTQPWLTLD